MVVWSNDLSGRAGTGDRLGRGGVDDATFLAPGARVLHSAGVLAALVDAGLLGRAVKVHVTFGLNWIIRAWENSRDESRFDNLLQNAII